MAIYQKIPWWRHYKSPNEGKLHILFRFLNIICLFIHPHTYKLVNVKKIKVQREKKIHQSAKMDTKESFLPGDNHEKLTSEENFCYTSYSFPSASEVQKKNSMPTSQEELSNTYILPRLSTPEGYPKSSTRCQGEASHEMKQKRGERQQINILIAIIWEYLRTYSYRYMLQK